MPGRPPKLAPPLLPGRPFPFGGTPPRPAPEPTPVPADVLKSGQTLSGALGYDLPVGINRSSAARKRMLRRVSR